MVTVTFGRGGRADLKCLICEGNELTWMQVDSEVVAWCACGLVFIRHRWQTVGVFHFGEDYDPQGCPYINQ